MKYQRIIGHTVTLTTNNPTQCENAPPGASMAEIRGTSTTTSFNFCPRLQGVLYFDNSAGTFTDASGTVTNHANATTLALSNFEASVDFLYLGVAVPFRGFYALMSSVNGNAAVLSASYWNGTWTDIGSITDGTSSSGATFGRSAIATWTIPTDWTTVGVSTLPDLFWVRLSSSATFDSDVTMSELVALGPQAAASVGAAIRVVTSTATLAPSYEFDNEAVGGVEINGSNLQQVRVEWFGLLSSSAVSI